MVEKRVIEIGETSHEVKIYVEKRNSVRASITRRGINLRIPKHLGIRERERQIEKMLSWANQRLRSGDLKQTTKKVYAHGDLIRTPSKTYQLDIEIRDSQKNFAKVSGNMIILKISNKHEGSVRQEYISKQLRRLLAQDNHNFLLRRVTELNRAYFGERVHKISFRHTVSRWGVCKMPGREIELSTKLLLAPAAILDYVIIHELAHLIEQNHSKKFWDIVKRVDPRYKMKKKWLKEHGEKLVI